VAAIVVITGISVATEFDTAQKRLVFAAQLNALPPAFQGMLGHIINIDRLGGFLSWRTINFMPTILGIWSVVALSGLLAGELSRGSLDLLATTPLGRARLAVQKVGGYLLAVVLTMVFFAVGTAVVIAGFGTLPEDAIDARSLLGHTAWLYCMTLTPGALAFAVAPLLGRSGALAAGGLVLFGSYMIYGYASSIRIL
jgi:ABC-type transport system involved in multi-copper enzyme maturation permease subunit